MSNIFHIKPIYKEFIWGGRKLIDYFHLPQSLEQIGTIYHVIAVPGHLDNLVEETGEPLSVFYQTNPALFRCNRKDLPIRMTTTCNEGRQSYQLHPTDDYALAHDGQYGKVSGSVALLPDGAEKRRLFGNLCTTREEFAKRSVSKTGNIFSDTSHKEMVISCIHPPVSSMAARVTAPLPAPSRVTAI